MALIKVKAEGTFLNFMSIEDLRTKISEIFSSIFGTLKKQVDVNFNKILKIIFSIGAMVVILVIVIAFFASAGSKKSNIHLKSFSVNETEKKEDIFKTLINDELMLPANSAFEVSDDYIDFMTLKEYTPPKIDMVIKDYRIILEDAVENELKFNFEMRGKNANKFK